MLAPDLIQIAGISDEAEARMLRRCGVNYLGFPLRLPIHREDISEADAAKIIGDLEAPAFGVLITYLDDAGEIAAFSDPEYGSRVAGGWMSKEGRRSC